MTDEEKVKAIAYLSTFLTDRRKELIDQILSQRTRHLTVVLEDVYKSQNASAVLRTCECQGIQDVYIVEDHHQYEINPDVLKGANKWLSLHHYPREQERNIERCFRDLRQSGYSIVGTHPHGNKSIENLQIDSPLALVFGTEYQGLTKYVQDNVDELVTIPMYGFTESYNLSVSAAISLQVLNAKIRSSDINWKLSQSEFLDVKLSWYKDHLRNADAVLKEWEKQVES